VDFAYHANHALALAAKQIISAYYGQTPRYAYFIGCSAGGREGLMERSAIQMTSMASWPVRLQQSYHR
jgi:tannase/feruloyl esterase